MARTKRDQNEVSARGTKYEGGKVLLNAYLPVLEMRMEMELVVAF